ncbi:EamA family transporter RarD [Corynebacterium sp. zg254]|uniref:EamA family transporter RarD n=1 Tax=Corynebacterium zhongnanshanii TaxID=2768834 RepID=A0ABQ6VDD4_9CORY|nr:MULTISPECIES: EamA family transporter RarD [Corynebacterium]KAB3520801.1 EamA family transporter RarD [Corynebacterium zhongnanshanii]MCR5914418.1 EamA family transporter RarD [Corynebacterium sp. zg254]
MIWGILCYLMWGFFPAFFPLLIPAEPLEILAHRFLWTLVFMVIVLLVLRKMGTLRGMSLRVWGLVTLAAVLISFNWGLYIVAVNSGHVADAALGYFINPLVSVVLGVVFLRERLRPLQTLSVAIATVAVVILTIALGQPPVISLGLAVSFGLYGLVKKRVPLSPMQSLTAETLVLAPLGLLYILFLEFTGANTFTTEGPAHAGLLMMAGVITALPLLCFARAAKEMTLTSLGMIQYLTPIMQMLWAVFVVNEHIAPARWVGFSIIWVAVTVFVIDLVLNTHKNRRGTLRRAR